MDSCDGEFGLTTAHFALAMTNCDRKNLRVADQKCRRERNADCRRRLHGIVDVPRHLRFNIHIHGGYRPVMTAASCVRSLGHFHNETLNIITHGLPVLYIVLNASNLLPWDDISVPLLPYVHMVAITAPWIGSSAYHLFMNATESEIAYKRLLQLDMIGIWISQSFGPITSIYVSVYCLPKSVQLCALSLYFFLSVVSLYKVLTANTPWTRRCSFLLQFLVRVSLYTLRTTSFGSGDQSAFKNVIVHDALAAIGAAIGATFVPERFFPGKLDYLGNSHQIMHVIMVVSLFYFHWGVTLDLLWLSRGESQCLR